MPQRKRTRALNPKAKPKLPNSKTDNYDVENKEERRKKLQVFLKDFDTKVESMELKLENDYKKLLVLIEQKFNFELSTLPTNIREMTLEDYILCGGTVEAASDFLSEENDVVHPALNTISKMTSANTVQSYRFRMNREDGQNPKNLTAPRTISRKHMMLAPSPMVGNNFITPCAGMSLAATGWGTPLITPKFDPRLPLTAAQKRPAKPGDIAMSIGGSPLEIPRKGKVLHRSGRTLQMKADASPGMDAIEIPDVLSRTQVTQVMQQLQDFLDKTKDD